MRWRPSARFGERVVLIVDTCELLLMVDHWLCSTLIPALPAHVRVVLAGRDAPLDRWRGYGPLLCSVPLTNLEPADAIELLHGSGVDHRLATRINSIARGHPLS